MLSEFKGFLLKTNALALAIGVIIGAALGTVVTSLVEDIIMPPIGLALGGVEFADLRWVLGSRSLDDGTSSEVAIRYGSFINAVITFVIVAFVVWRLSKVFIKEPPPDEVKTCRFCKEPNAIDASRCKACTSEI